MSISQQCSTVLVRKSERTAPYCSTGGLIGNPQSEPPACLVLTVSSNPRAIIAGAPRIILSDANEVAFIRGRLKVSILRHSHIVQIARFPSRKNTSPAAMVHLDAKIVPCSGYITAVQHEIQSVMRMEVFQVNVIMNSEVEINRLKSTVAFPSPMNCCHVVGWVYWLVQIRPSWNLRRRWRRCSSWPRRVCWPGRPCWLRRGCVSGCIRWDCRVRWNR